MIAARRKLKVFGVEMTRRDLLLVAALVLVLGHYAAARAHHHGSHSGEDDPVNMNCKLHGP